MFAAALRFVRPAVVSPPLPPYLAGGFDDEAQLSRLLRNRECVAFDRGRKTALRAEAELLERHVSGGLVDPRFKSSLLSSAGRLLVTRPNTTRLLPRGTNRSGAKPPERASSYSRKKPSTASSPNSASATWS